MARTDTNAGSTHPVRHADLSLCGQRLVSLWALILKKCHSPGGWTVEQALTEVKSDGTLASLANAKKEHVYAVEMNRWIEVGSPRYPVDHAYYLRLGMFPVWTLDEADRPRRLTKYELPPNPFLAAAAQANANLHLSRVTGLVRGFRSGEVVAAGAKGHPTNPVSWLPPHVWTNYMPNVPSNEARWSAALDLGRERGEMVLLQELLGL